MSDCRIGRKYQRLNFYFFISVSEFLSIDVKTFWSLFSSWRILGIVGIMGNLHGDLRRRDSVKTRSCTNPAPQYGGSDCTMATQTCNTHNCPSTTQYTHQFNVNNTLLWINVLFMNKRWCANMLSAYDYKKDYIFNLGTDVLEKKNGDSPAIIWV